MNIRKHHHHDGGDGNHTFQIRNSNSVVSEIAWFSLAAAIIKILLIPAYHSSDFEVHRNWLAITHSLPLSQWYADETSPWTLDYPPLFAHFEHLLSFFAAIIDPTMVDLHGGLDYKSTATILFQRLSVTLSDVVLVYAIYRLSRNLELRERILMWVLVLWSPGLIIVDHLHFQYNGFLLGILLLSLSALEEGKDLLGGFLFAVLLCFKHLFAVAAPVYFVYLLRHYCRGGWFKGIGRLALMGSVVISVFAAAFGPFMHYGQIHQVLNRMFPFGRGLCHAYWAPNFWVFYILLDKVVAFILTKFGFTISAPTASFTSGLVGDSSPFAVLPRVTPLTTFGMVLLALIPSLVKAWKDPKPGMITRLVAYAYTCGFMFGWHVHEKASLHFVIPLAVVASKSMEDGKHYFFLSIVSCYSFFPLLFEAQEYPIKVLLLLLHVIIMWLGFSFQHFSNNNVSKEAAVGKRCDEGETCIIASRNVCFQIGFLEKIYLLGLLAVEAWGLLFHRLILGQRFPFLPLLMISAYCSIGMMYSWIWQVNKIFQSN
ncbi:unnamed protein product [Cuscuta epithymum]|uniref:Alpha-1,3-glucosyltransferase n=1 Tax=Cuscuta epithymum TaxID=186058 RepID=A0AAV0DCP2_9ASTE|nr:unnamed protein product [Cuscuta epithymum]